MSASEAKVATTPTTTTTTRASGRTECIAYRARKPGMTRCSQAIYPRAPCGLRGAYMDPQYVSAAVQYCLDWDGRLTAPSPLGFEHA